MIPGAAGLLLALAAASGIQFVAHEGSGEVTLAVVELGQGRFLNFLDFPGTDGEPDGVDSSLFEHRETQVARVLAGPRLPARITVRRVYPEAASMRRGRVFKLALLERTDAGHWHIQWDTEVRHGRACLSREAIAHFRIVVPRRMPDRNGEICIRL